MDGLRYMALAAALSILASCQSSTPGPTRGLIAFTGQRDGWFSIYTVRPDGAGLRKLIDIVTTQGAGESNFLDILGQAAWSADGSKIAFVCPSRGQSEICVANSDGSHAIVVTSNPLGPDRLPATDRRGVGAQHAACLAAGLIQARLRSSGRALRH